MGAAPRVLLIEPHHLLARALRRGLEEEGLAVTVAPGREEIDFTAPLLDCDVIILGLAPPRADDRPLIQRWRRQGLQAPVLVLTAAGRSADDERGTEAGADDYLTMPFGLEELFSRVRALTRR
jgi:DNA-binding response OmpR family regulator